MSRSPRLLVGTTLAALLVATSASAQDPALAAASEAAFKDADFDANGKVSWEEFRNRVVAVFGHLDHNQDGRLAGDEHPPARDKSGKPVQPPNITAEAFTASAAEAFKASDTDGDGELSAAEWSASKP